MSWLGYSLAGLCLLASASCKDGGKCSDEELVAIEVHVKNPEDLAISVTAELKSEEECPFFVDPGTGRVYTCYEQGGGTYKVRIYVGDKVIYEEDDEVEADACHIKQRFVSEIDLTAVSPTAP
jgi:hypothetical protein